MESFHYNTSGAVNNGITSAQNLSNKQQKGSAKLILDKNVVFHRQQTSRVNINNVLRPTSELLGQGQAPNQQQKSPCIPVVGLSAKSIKAFKLNMTMNKLKKDLETGNTTDQGKNRRKKSINRTSNGGAW